MKQKIDTASLAARLGAAASTPLPVPPIAAMPTQERRNASDESSLNKTKLPGRPKEDTVAVTLRPSRELMQRLIEESARRSTQEGRMITTQKLILEAVQQRYGQ